MLTLLSLIFGAVSLTLLIVFFVLFLISTARMKSALTGANEKIRSLQEAVQAAQTENKTALVRLVSETQRINAETQEVLQAVQTENKTALARLASETQRINAETADTINQKHEEYCVKLAEAQSWCIDELKKQQEDTKVNLAYIQTTFTEKMEQMNKAFQQDSINLKTELNSRVDSILKEITAPLLDS